MARLIYTALASLDGYVADEDGKWDWAMPDEELHTFLNDLTRPLGTHLYGRRMYEVLVAWETIDTGGDAVLEDFAGSWRAADKVVYSRTLETVASSRTRIEREFEPEAVRRMKESAERDLAIGGPELAAQGFGAGLVDECHLVLAPVLVGGGKRALPGGVQLELELLDERRVGDRFVYLHYRAGPSTSAIPS